MEDEDDEPSLVQYARYHGLARDHTLDDGDDTDYTHLGPIDLSSDLADPEHAPSIQVPLDFAIAEKLSLDAQAKAFLASITAVQTRPSEIYLDHLDVRSLKWRKLDLPLLSTDHELDVSFSAPRKFDEALPISCLPFVVDEEHDEGLQWPSKFHSLPDLYDTRLRTEKIEASRESFLLLKSTLSGVDALHAEEEVFAEDSAYRRIRALDPVTPPLSPLTPPLDATNPSSPVEYVDPLSEHTSPLAAELNALNARVMEADLIQPLAVKGRIWDIQDPLRTDELVQYLNSETSARPAALSSSPHRPRAIKLKIEEPLTPPSTVKAATSAACSDNIERIVPGLSQLQEEQSVTSEEAFESLFNDVVCTQALKAEYSLENEELQEADSTKRVTVPIMDFSIPPPPWKMPFAAIEGEAENHELSRLIARLKMHHLPVSKIDRQLLWNPFPLELGKIAVEEQMVDEGLAAKFIDQSGFDNGVDINSLTWKPDGLRILDDSDDDEEELQPASFNEPNDMVSLLRKRKTEFLNEDDARPDFDDGVFTVVHASNITMAQDSQSRTKDLLSTTRPPTHKSAFVDPFSASDEISRFISVQTGQMKKRKIEAVTAVHKSTIASRSQPLVDEKEDRNGIIIPVPSKSQPLFVPGTEPSDIPRPLIVSSTFLAQHHLIRHIMRLYPAVDLIERGTTFLGITGGIAGKQSQLRREDADLTISPGSGIICTSLQQIKQKPLPGQADGSIIRDIILTVASRYERLIVLVSAKSNTAATNTLDERDCQALTDLMIFSAGLDDEVAVNFVAGGDEELARWIVGSMTLTAPPRADLKLLQDETLWELFLRKAGMNAFAAQIILSELKASDEDVASSSGPRQEQTFGLPAFVSMSAEERIRRLEDVLEGRKVLTSVSAVLDAPWGFVGV